jgi:peroxiredoxin
MFEIDESYEELRAQGVEVLAVAVDRAEDVEVFLERQSIECPVLLDEESEVAKQFGINALPTTVLLDNSGKIIHTHVGLIADLSDHVLDRLSRQDAALHPAQ